SSPQGREVPRELRPTPFFQAIDSCPRAPELEAFRRHVDRAFLGHPIVTDNSFTRWFRGGSASLEDLRHFTVQFSVFSNQFLVAQLKKMINADSLDSMRSAKEILANEIGVIFHDRE